MNQPTSTKRNPLILVILSLSVIVFAIGTFLFFKYDWANKSLKTALLKDGIQAKAYVSGKSIEEDRRISMTDSKWQHQSTHFITFSYNHRYSGTIEAEKNKYSLEHYLPDGKDSKTTKDTSNTAKGLGKLEVQVIVEEAFYNSLESGASIDVIYLAGDPSSIKILHEDGEIRIPMLSIFSYICLFLTLGSVYSLYYFLKTGKTF